MPRTFNFYVIAPERLREIEGDTDENAIERHGARWGQIESKASRMCDTFDELDRLLGGPVIARRVGALSVEETTRLAASLTAASPDVLARIDAAPTLASAYWTLRETAEEARRRGACMVIQCLG